MQPEPLPSPVLEILAERERQLARGVRTPAGDDRLARGELAIAAALYLLAGIDATVVEPYGVRSRVQALDRRASLVRGIALALAELERHDRAGSSGAGSAGAPPARMGRADHPACVERCSSPVCFNCR